MFVKLTEVELIEEVRQLHKDNNCDWFDYDVDDGEIFIKFKDDFDNNNEAKVVLSEFVNDTYGWVLTDPTIAFYDPEWAEELKSRNI